MKFANAGVLAVKCNIAPQRGGCPGSKSYHKAKRCVLELTTQESDPKGILLRSVPPPPDQLGGFAMLVTKCYWVSTSTIITQTQNAAADEQNRPFPWRWSLLRAVSLERPWNSQVDSRPDAAVTMNNYNTLGRRETVRTSKEWKTTLGKLVTPPVNL